MQRVSPVLTSVSTKAAGYPPHDLLPVAQAAAVSVKLGDQTVVFQLIDIIIASPSIKYN